MDRLWQKLVYIFLRMIDSNNRFNACSTISYHNVRLIKDNIVDPLNWGQDWVFKDFLFFFWFSACFIHPRTAAQEGGRTFGLQMGRGDRGWLVCWGRHEQRRKKEGRREKKKKEGFYGLGERGKQIRARRGDSLFWYAFLAWRTQVWTPHSSHFSFILLFFSLLVFSSVLCWLGWILEATSFICWIIPCICVDLSVCFNLLWTYCDHGVLKIHTHHLLFIPITFFSKFTSYQIHFPSPMLITSRLLHMLSESSPLIIRANFISFPSSFMCI